MDCENWTVKKAERRRIDAFELWCWRRLLKVPWTARKANQSILKEISPKYSLEGLMLKLKSNTLGTWCEELTLWNPMDCSTPGFPVHHHLLELTQTHVHWISDAIQPSYPLSPPSLTLNLSQYQSLFQWIGSLHQVVKVLELQQVTIYCLLTANW